MDEIRKKILKILAEEPQKKLRASEIKRKAEGLPEDRKVDARDYGNILRGLKFDGFLESDSESYPVKWGITEKGLNRLEEGLEMEEKMDSFPEAPRGEKSSETRMELYERGFLDKEIAERMDVSQSAVQAWRSRRDLPPNPAEEKRKIGRGLEEIIKPYLIRRLEDKIHLDEDRVASEILESLNGNMEWGKAWERAKKLLNEELSGVTPEDVIDGAGKEEEIQEEIREKAKQIISEYREEKPISGSPSVNAAASIYIASLLLDERLTQKKIASAFDVTSAGLRERYSRIAESIGIDYTHTISGFPKVEER
ncbi:hypothetical protein AKJ56_01125 [candidate division MSBL1 archaeon SCGC-AAA382N08]|uniref:Transcription factor TFIIB cyclin-like domain-containing protein n=1 Tax=candidate division MSBL1 archaeon SCGC-AAA382N08 TaxID=1698285 RepID=A0A133VPY0_9EURY|nr:hypothetical protein AKJ56_01125 [candidate division MSBL1 archaeon SCGC-AAA382N08]